MKAVAEATDSAVALSPVGKDLHPQIEIHHGAHERFHLEACGAADVANALATGADENALLALPLDVQHGPNVQKSI